MSNLSILQRNMLATMGEEAQKLYLRGCDSNEWRAVQMAWEWDLIEPYIQLTLEAAHTLHNCSDAGVYEFIKERHYRRWFSGN